MTGITTLRPTIMNNPKQLTFPWNKAYKSSFDHFYEDPSNSELISTIADLSQLDDIFIYGNQDSGKTYLLQSLCNAYSGEGRPSLYIPLKEVISYGVGILDSVETMDLVCLDGLEHITSDKEWEKGIFNLINSSLNSNCRLVFASSLEIGSLSFSLPDLESRLRKVASYELFQINQDNLLEALKSIANLRSIDLGGREAQYLLTYAKRNLSDLVRILESLDQLSMEMKRKITIPLIKKLL
jgi:DnaA family protein